MTQEQYDDHDCHLSPNDGCAVCEEWFNTPKETVMGSLQKLEESVKRLQETIESPYPFGFPFK